MNKEEFLSVRKFVGDFENFEKFAGFYNIAIEWAKYLSTNVYEGIRPFYFTLSKRPEKMIWKNNDAIFVDLKDLMKKDVPKKIMYPLSLDDMYGEEAVNKNYKIRGHGNVVIIDTVSKEIWVFEPHGSRSSDLYTAQRTKSLEEFSKATGYGFKNVRDLPYSGAQAIEGLVKDHDQISLRKTLLKQETNGYCVAWSLMFMHYVGLNPDLTVPEVVKLITFRFSGKELAKRIRAYAGAIYRYFESKGRDLPIGADEKYVIPQSDTLYKINQNCKVFLDQISRKEARLRDIIDGTDIPAALIVDQHILDQLFYCGVNNRDEVLRNFRLIRAPAPRPPAPRPVQKKKAAPKFKKPVQKKKAAPRKQRKPVQKKAAPKFKKPAQKKKAVPRKQRKPVQKKKAVPRKQRKPAQKKKAAPRKQRR